MYKRVILHDSDWLIFRCLSGKPDIPFHTSVMFLVNIHLCFPRKQGISQFLVYTGDSMLLTFFYAAIYLTQAMSNQKALNASLVTTHM